MAVKTTNPLSMTDIIDGVNAKKLITPEGSYIPTGEEVGTNRKLSEFYRKTGGIVQNPVTERSYSRMPEAGDRYYKDPATWREPYNEYYLNVEVVSSGIVWKNYDVRITGKWANSSVNIYTGSILGMSAQWISTTKTISGKVWTLKAGERMYKSEVVYKSTGLIGGTNSWTERWSVYAELSEEHKVHKAPNAAVPTSGPIKFSQLKGVAPAFPPIYKF